MLPEKIRKTLQTIVKGMRNKDNVYGVGLFGSWSRGEATASSDVDLLVLEKGKSSYEYVERIENSGLLIDLDYVPRQFIKGPIPPELDQKLYEMQILYDRDWSLANTKLLMAKTYGSPERVDIRTEAHIIDSDIYLSRATSALSRGDFASSWLFATVASEHALKVLVEMALLPFSNSHFVERSEGSAASFDMRDLFARYMEISKLSSATTESVRHRLRLFKAICGEIDSVVRQNSHEAESVHPKVRSTLSYCLNPAFLQGVVMRTESLLEAQKASEALHYLRSIILEAVENYVWFRSSIDKVRTDYTTLVCSLESLEHGNIRNYRQIVQSLDLENISKADAVDAVERTREAMLKTRKKRKTLIKNHLTKG